MSVCRPAGSSGLLRDCCVRSCCVNLRTSPARPPNVEAPRSERANERRSQAGDEVSSLSAEGRYWCDSLIFSSAHRAPHKQANEAREHKTLTSTSSSSTVPFIRSAALAVLNCSSQKCNTDCCTDCKGAEEDGEEVGVGAEAEVEARDDEQQQRRARKCHCPAARRQINAMQLMSERLLHTGKLGCNDAEMLNRRRPVACGRPAGRLLAANDDLQQQQQHLEVTRTKDSLVYGSQ